MEEKKKTGAPVEEFCLIMPGKQKDLFTAAVIILKDSLLKKFPNFDVKKDCIISFGNDLSEINLGGKYQKILIVDPDNKLLKLDEFIVKNCYGKLKKRFFWYLGRSAKTPIMTKFFGEDNVHLCDDNCLYSKPTLLNDYALKILGAIYSLRWGVPDASPIMKRVSEATSIAKLKDREKSSTPTSLEIAIKELLFELITKKESPLIASLIVDFKLLKEAERRAKKTKIQHPILGKLKIVKPKKGLVIENKTFFEQGFQLGYDAVAVKSTEGDYELCVKKIHAQKVINEIPIIKRINGCRFIVSKKVLMQEPGQ